MANKNTHNKNIQKYDHKKVEKHWQEKWSQEKLYRADLTKEKKFYNLWMFPYPSAEGLHAGHAFASTGSDIYGRFRRMQGFEVFQPIGYDSFGIHSENFAIKIGEHPQVMLSRTTKNYERQMSSLGHAYDWTRTVTTSDESYYKWTQWLFLQMFKSGLAYRKKAQVNWCPSCKTVLADEQVIDGACERCKSIVEKKELEQWFFRIVDYAERLLTNLNSIDWSEIIKIAQTNWIGKKSGINIHYKIEGTDKEVVCFTSRPETNFGATFIVLSPHHPLAQEIALEEHAETVKKYIKEHQMNSENKNNDDNKEKTGVFTGRFAINQLNQKKLPIYVADYVLSNVGTGAVVGVPAHDSRDFEFAQTHGIEVVRVVSSTQENKAPIETVRDVYESDGIIANSDFLNGLTTQDGMEKIIGYISDKGFGERITSYHLRDWLISRQRYWGPPIPMIYCSNCAQNKKGWMGENGANLLHQDQSDWEWYGWYPVEEESLPIKLPFVTEYKPTGENTSPLAAHKEFYETKYPVCKADARRETDVSDTFLDSSWYFLRYPSVDSLSSSIKPFDTEITKKWLPVDLYFGGAEHAVLHLMYARFVTMVLYDLKLVTFEEPFPKFYAHGLMIKDGAKMSKSRGNVVNPDEYIEKFGADTMRLYIMFMGPMNGSPDFRDTGIEGMRRFTERVIRVLESVNDAPSLSADKEATIRTIIHKTIKKVTEDIKRFHYNTAIASMMEYVRFLETQLEESKPSKSTQNTIWKEAISTLAQLLAPFAPHLTEEAWHNLLGNNASIHKSTWPTYNEDLIKESEVIIVVQVNGKVRGQIKVNANNIDDEKLVIATAKQDQKISEWIKDKQIKKEIYIKGKILNIVVGE